MPVHLIIASAFASHNLHGCLYEAFGAALLLRACLAARDNRNDVAREDAVIGLMHVLLGLF